MADIFQCGMRPWAFPGPVKATLDGFFDDHNLEPTTACIYQAAAAQRLVGGKLVVGGATWPDESRILKRESWGVLWSPADECARWYWQPKLADDIDEDTGNFHCWIERDYFGYVVDPTRGLEGYPPRGEVYAALPVRVQRAIRAVHRERLDDLVRRVGLCLKRKRSPARNVDAREEAA